MDVPMGNNPTSEQKTNLQKLLAEELGENILSSSAHIEYSFSSEHRDRCDVFVSTPTYQIMVELDATRADQVAKKMLSRYYFAQMSSEKKPTVYVCLLYPGTESMNPQECVKYMHMGKEVFLAMNSSNRFIGGFINGNTVEWKDIG